MPEPKPQTPQRTWNTPEDIARHRAMTPEQRLRRAIELSRAALRFANARRVDGR
jgi:hypothetical protein